MTTKVRHVGKNAGFNTATMKMVTFIEKHITSVSFVCLIYMLCIKQPINALSIDQKSIVSNQVLPSEHVKSNTELAEAPAIPSGEEAAHKKTRTDLRRPIWVLAHMVNSIKELDYRLARGANAVEADVTFGRQGDPLYTYHGPPCDCWRHCYQQEDFGDYLNYVREISIDSDNGIGQNLTLLFLDLKLDALDQRAKAYAGRQLAQLVAENLFTNNQKPAQQKRPVFRLIISVNHVHDADLIHNFIHQLEMNNSTYLMQRIGFDVGMNDDLQSIETMWRRFGSDLNLWQGDGYTNCLSPFYNLERLTKALKKRDQNSGFPAKVYHWTIDLHDRVRESLRLGVDAIMTNHPERILNVLQEPEMVHSYRLANRFDDPFKKLTREFVSRFDGETARYQRSVSTTSGSFLTSLLDIFASWMNYVREIPIFSLPATFVLSRSPKQRPQLANISSNTVMPVKLQNQSPEYSIDSSARLDNLTSAQPAADRHEQNSENKPASDELAYEGPKWYTTLASNMLVAMMKIFLPS